LLPPADNDLRAIRFWLLTVAALVVTTVLVGGATRLTESGLSIVEWKPVTGILPPMSQPTWQLEFEKYQAIPQYQAINLGMSLHDFKTIYWWEWTHRLLGRLIGAVFLLPFLFFLWRGWLDPPQQRRLWIILGLGALQGALGWWMVASGLAGRIDVSQYRLAAHLTLACVIYAAIVWTLQRLTPGIVVEVSARIRASTIILLGLILAQIYLGGLVAGLHAGLIYNTWPLMDGRLLPGASELLSLRPVWRNFFEAVLTVQFNHRILAYLLWIGAFLHFADVMRTQARWTVMLGAGLLVAAVTLQAGLGIMTLLYQTPISLALLHQAMALVVLTIAVLHAGRLQTKIRGRSGRRERSMKAGGIGIERDFRSLRLMSKSGACGRFCSQCLGRSPIW
jgi:cytochrome c oxidase assembly protein subunit 15